MTAPKINGKGADWLFRAAALGLGGWVLVTVQETAVLVGELKVQVEAFQDVRDRVSIIEARIGRLERP